MNLESAGMFCGLAKLNTGCAVGPVSKTPIYSRSTRILYQKIRTSRDVLRFDHAKRRLCCWAGEQNSDIFAFHANIVSGQQKPKAAIQKDAEDRKLQLKRPAGFSFRGNNMYSGHGIRKKSNANPHWRYFFMRL